LRRLVAVAFVAVLGGCSSHQLDLEALSSASDQVVWEAGQ